MSCLCVNRLAALASSLRNLPLALLSSLAANHLSPLSAVAALAPQVCASLSATATADATATATASATFSATAVANLEALASVNASMGTGPFSPAAAGRMSAMITSTNQQLPDILAALNDFLKPISDALDKLQAALASLQGIQALTGQNLMLPGTAFLMPVASASVAASASASAAASATATATAAMSANAMMAMRLNAAAIGMGFPLPGNVAGLNAALQMAAGLPVVTLPASLLQSIINQLAALANAAQMLGGSLSRPNAGALLNEALATALDNLNAVVAGTATATAAPQALSVAAISAAANLDTNAILSAAASLTAPALPDLQPLAASLSLSESLNSLTGTSMFASKPCGSCAFKF